MSHRLNNAPSAYLRHHADQPVDWYPWGPEALQKAQQEDKPILLSIGYQACHWCHVMANESFSDEGTAALMNTHFINIKVDREERPDIDQLYQQTHQILRRSGGGWPLTAFLSPQGVPFYSGTYFPREAQADLPALSDILQSVSNVWRDRREALATQDQALIKRLIEMAPRATDVVLDAQAREGARQQLSVAFDADHGGFGIAPKFPHPTDLAFLLRRGRDEQDEHARHMALFTLHKMAEGGLYDQLGGGFFRYSVDASWQVPHFEKMLCDNALLLSLYADALTTTGTPLFRQVIEGTVEWVMRDMLLPSGGMRATLPADDKSGVEGGDYIWASELFRTALKPGEWDVCGAHWGLIDAPNIVGQYWHLHVARPVASLARTLDYPEDVVKVMIDAGKAKLLALRQTRPQAEADEQVLTSWQALMITGLVHAAQACQRPEWLDAARAALQFIRTQRWTPENGLISSTGQAAFLDDHAFLLEAVLALHQAGPQTGDIAFAKALADTLLTQFEDPAEGGFFFTRHDAPALFHRFKPSQDTATPSGNGTAALALIDLADASQDTRYRDAARRCVHAMAATVAADPTSHTRLLLAAERL